MSGKRRSASRAAFIGCMAFLFVPLAVLVFFSFNENKAPIFTGFSLIWYGKLFTQSASLWAAFFRSISIALAASATATAIGTLAAIGVHWHDFPLKGYVQAVTYIPLVLPEIIIGMSLLAFFAGIKLPVLGHAFAVGIKVNLGWWTIFIAHATFCLPFAYMMVLARLDEFDSSIIEAARDLGATEFQTLSRVIIPVSKPGIVSGFLTSFTLSLEDFTITYFVSGVSTTMPMVVYGQMYKGGVSPVINALSTLMILGTVVLAFFARKWLRYIAASS
jgi:spermidine/putrescine transport system permease protein